MSQMIQFDRVTVCAVVIQSLLQRSCVLLIPALAALTWLSLSPAARAVSPPPDGGYPGFNTAEGDDALFSLTTGTQNTATGTKALFANTTGGGNTADGGGALLNNTTGGSNTANGLDALLSNTIGSNNTASGLSALDNNDSGNNNTASGAYALFRNVAGSYNMATGFTALYNSTGDYNTASGAQALLGNSSGSDNTADGGQALISNTTGNFNTATGAQALFHNTVGHDNAATGFNTLVRNTSGSFNIGVGSNAGGNLTTGSNNIDIGANVLGNAGEANTIRIGKQGTQKVSIIAGIYNVAEPIAGGIKPVYINSNGQLGTAPPASSARFKEAIKPMDKSSEAILALKPVTFRYKNDEGAAAQFGLIAEEVAKVNPDLVLREDNGKIYTVRYEAVNAMLLNEFLKEHRKVEDQERNAQEQQSTITALKGAVVQQQKQIEALTATVQKVRDQVALSKPAPPLVANP